MALLGMPPLLIVVHQPYQYPNNIPRIVILKEKYKIIRMSK
jgi:hypothetical protein